MNFNKTLITLKNNIKREPWLALSSILVMTLTFLALNFFIFLLTGSSVILKYLEEKAQVTIFFSDTISEDEVLKLKSQIESDPRISIVKYVSKDDAMKIFKELSKDEPALFESLESNPLPASLEVKAKKIGDLEVLSGEYVKLNGVEDVKFYKDVVDNFRRWSMNVRIASLALLVVLSLVSVVMILMTTGVTIHSKGIEVEIMKLVGATDRYVKGPLVLQGVFYGVCASVISLVIMHILIIVFSPVLVSFFGSINVSSDLSLFVKLFWLPVLASPSSFLDKLLSLSALFTIEIFWGVVLGYTGSALAIKKYLKY